MTAFVLLLLQVASALECEEPASAEQIREELQAIEARYADLDESGFTDAVNLFQAYTLPCASEPLSPELAAHMHRLLGIQAYMAGDEAATDAAFQAAKTADPDYVFPDELVPEGSPLRTRYDSLEPGTPRKNAPDPKAMKLFLDGEETRKRPTTVPVLTQLVDESGEVRSTQLLNPGESFPEYEAVPHVRNNLLIVAGSIVAASAGVYGGALASKGAVVNGASDPNQPDDFVTSGATRTNALVLTSAGLLAAGVGTGVGAFFVGDR